MDALATSCPWLLHLDVSHCTQLTDAAIHTLARGCPRLAVLNVEGCDSLTSTALQQLIFGEFSSLRKIVLSDLLMFEVTMITFIMSLV